MTNTERAIILRLRAYAAKLEERWDINDRRLCASFPVSERQALRFNLDHILDLHNVTAG